MLTLHHADGLEPLLGSLAEVLGPPLADPFTPHVIAVPSSGMADAVMAALGKRLGAGDHGDGIVANINFLFPGQFVERALGASDTASDPWSIERLTWTVLRVLDADPALLPWSTGTGATASNSGRDPWALARRIADLYDQYASQRPSLISAWAAGTDTDGTLLADGHLAPLDARHVWQARLWREVRREIGVPSPPERLPMYLEHMRSGEIQPNLPERVSVFGFGSLPFTFLSVLRALAQVRDAHVFVRHPSRVAWSSSANRLAGAVQVRANVDVAAHVNHPLLASWGRPALEARALLAGMPDVSERAADLRAVTQPSTLLEYLQHGIRHDIAPSAATGLSVVDQSVQVHACHGALRQLEVLRDALGHAFLADPTLRAHEVLVLCPELERFAPLVESVFARGDLPIPVRVGDRSLTSEDPLAGVLIDALKLVEGRATLSQVLSLAQREPVRARFGWDADHIGRLAAWCTDLGTHWGLVPEHRLPWGIPAEITNGTWRAMSDRLLAGAAFPAPVARVALGDVVPFDDMGSDDVTLAGSMADFLARLEWLHSEVHSPKPISAWVDTLHTAVDHFCAVGRDEGWRLGALHRVLDDVLDAATSAEGPSTIPLGITDVEAVLSNHLADRPGRLRLRSGAVTVTSLIPLRSVPARVVCILGLDEGAVRSGSLDGDDVLGERSCVGERHPRFDSRQLLLDAVLSPSDRLIITCDGADLTTNQEVPFVVALAEFLETVGELRGSNVLQQDDNAPTVVVRHPRHGFHEAALVPGGLLAGSNQPFTFDPSMREAAEARRRAYASNNERGEGDKPLSRWAVPPRAIDTVNLDEAVAAIVNPSRTYLRQRLDIRLPGDIETLDDGLAIGLDPLETAGLGRDLLDARRRGVAFDEWTTTVRLAGTLPPGDLSTAALDAVVGEVQDFEAALQEWGLPEHAEGEAEVSLSLQVPLAGGAPTTVLLAGTIDGITGNVLADTRYARPRPSQRLGLAVRLAALQVHYPDTDWTAVLVTRKSADSDSKVPVTAMRLRGSGEDRTKRATAFLVRALEVFSWALRDAVPLFERTSLALASGSWGGADTALESDLNDDAVRFLWGDTNVDDLRDAPHCAGDPTTVGPSDSGGRAVAVAEWVWGLLRASVEYVDRDGAVIDASADEAREDDE